MIYSPDHRVTLRLRSRGLTPLDISKDVVSIETGKNHGYAAGGFEIRLVYKKDAQGMTLADIAKPNDIVLIELDRGDGGGLKPVMLGLLSRPARSKSIGRDGKPRFSIVLGGMDFGKILTRHNVGWDLAQQLPYGGDSQAQRLHDSERRGTLFQYCGTPKKNVISLLDNLFFPQLGGWVREYIDYSGVVTDDNWTTFNKTFSMQSGDVWSALKSLANEPWNVLYTDTTTTGRFRIFLERYPFDSTTGKLTVGSFYEVSEDDIVTENLGIDDTDLVNYAAFESLAQIFGGDGFAYIFLQQMKSDPESVAIHGWRPFTPGTPYLPLLDEKHQNASDKPLLQAILSRTTAIFNWHKNAHTYQNGTIAFHGDPAVRCGMGLLIPETGMEYYVESVSHNYVVGEHRPTYRTTTKLTRGQKH